MASEPPPKPSRRRLAAFITAGIVLAVLLLGPRPEVREPTINSATEGIPTDLNMLESWLADTERQSGDVIQGAEKHIRWHSGVERSEIAVVYLHGFSATRQETAPLTAHVAKALAANSFEARLRGHGRNGEALGEATADQWMEDALEAVAVGHRIGRRVVLIGVSTGGTLALWLSAHDEILAMGALDAVVVMSPNLGPRDPTSEVLTLPWMEVVLPLVMPERAWEPQNEAQRRFWTTRYPTEALFPMQALVEHVRGLSTRMGQVPTLFIYCPRDEVIDAERVEALAETLPASHTRIRKVNIPAGEGTHVLAGDILAPTRTAPMAGAIVDFVERRW